MLPSLVAREVIEAVRAQLHAQFPSLVLGCFRSGSTDAGDATVDDATPRAAVDDLLDAPGAVFRGPHRVEPA